MSTAGSARLHAIDALTGTAREFGTIPQRNQATDLAPPLDQH
ncbi:hypothetical protein [Streptomyces rubiginosohelvolus]|uniref:Uncharacterized protein n=1 Tax=Streptomyces rubiginosohelvolus TaxID=67362 RepID=A0ABW6F929_9ACTN